MKKKYSRHHHRPRSRGGKNNDTVSLPIPFHEALHCLFGNLYGEEMEKFIAEINWRMTVQKVITNSDLHELREQIKGGVENVP